MAMMVGLLSWHAVWWNQWTQIKPFADGLDNCDPLRSDLNRVVVVPGTSIKRYRGKQGNFPLNSRLPSFYRERQINLPLYQPDIQPLSLFIVWQLLKIYQVLMSSFSAHWQDRQSSCRIDYKGSSTQVPSSCGMMQLFYESLVPNW